MAGAVDALYGAVIELVGELGLTPEPFLPDEVDPGGPPYAAEPEDG